MIDIETALKRKTVDEKWRELGDRAADFALMIQTSAKAPRRIVKTALELIELHRELRPEQYGPRREPEPDFYGEIIEPPAEGKDR